MICHRCRGIPLDLFLDDRSIQYELHHSVVDFFLSAISGCHSCRILWQQRASELDLGFCPPNRGIGGDSDSYWIEWDNQEDKLVLASGWNHYFLEYDSETGLRTRDITPALAASSSSESLGIIRTWLNKCLNEHEHCWNEDGLLPTRLLDIGPADGSQKPRIVCRTQLKDRRAKYLTLSYCWGQTTNQSPWTLKKTNIDRFKVGIERDQLPQSFQDLIKLTRALKERFVWIDALCILQDSPDDWEREAASMARIYMNSLCTVISPASDPKQPLFIKRDISLTKPATLQLAPSDGGPSAVVRLHPVLPKWNRNYKFGIERGDESGLQAKQPTRKRAWCLQEYELSRRTITFTSHQFVWLCGEMQCSEEEFSDMSRPLAAADDNYGGIGYKLPSGYIEQLLWWPFGLFGRAARLSSLDYLDRWPEGRALQIARFNRKLAEPPGLFRKWEKLVEVYTSRGLSQPADRLSAIAGLADKRYQETNDQYLMGLWKSNLKNELLWCVYGPTRSSRIAELSIVPTWSWVAINSAIYFPRRPYDLNMSESRMPSPIGDGISIEEIEVDRIDHNPFTETSSIRLTIEGRLIQASIRNTGHKDGSVYGWELVDKRNSALGHISLDDQRLFLPEGLTVVCLWVDPGIVQDADLEAEPERYTGGFGLALSPMPDTKGGPTYIRVGFVHFDRQVIKWIHKVEKFRFTIL